MPGVHGVSTFHSVWWLMHGAAIELSSLKRLSGSYDYVKAYPYSAVFRSSFFIVRVTCSKPIALKSGYRPRSFSLNNVAPFSSPLHRLLGSQAVSIATISFEISVVVVYIMLISEVTLIRVKVACYSRRKEKRTGFCANP